MVIIDTDGNEKVSALEKLYGSKDIEVDLNIDSGLGGKVKVAIDWDIIDNATAEYAELIKEYDFALIMKDLVSRYSKSSAIQIMPMAGNISFTDKHVNFADFYTELEGSRERLTKKLFSSRENEIQLKERCHSVVKYLTSGTHQDDELSFAGWRKTFNLAKTKNKQLCLGVLSVDIPTYYKTKGNKIYYIPSGTQHYVSFAYEFMSRKLFLFDSASKDPMNDKTEVYFILKFAFEELEGTAVEVIGMKFPHILQPGAGDQQTENERSYNNQNVFCHTWSLWFGTMVAMFFDAKKGFVSTGLMNHFADCAHRDGMLNLAMIKRFAFWLSSFLADDANTEARSPKRQRAYDKAVRENNASVLKQMYKDLYMQQNKLQGLNFIWNYKLDKPLLVEDICIAGKVKFDMLYVESEVSAYTIDAFAELTKKKRCPLGYILNEKTKRCRKLRN